MDIKKYLNSHKAIIIDIALILAVGLLSITWFRGDFIIKAGDTFFSPRPLNDLSRSIYIWEPNLATGFPYYTGYLAILPYKFFMAFLELIGISIVPSQKILTYLLFTASGLSMYLLSSSLNPLKKRRIAALASSLFYMLNPFALIVWGTSPLPSGLIFAYISFPLVLWLFIKGVNSQLKVENVFLASVFLLVLACGIAQPAFAITAVIMLLTYLIFHFFINKNRSDTLKTLKFICLLAIFFVLLNLFWLLPTIYFSNQSYALSTANSSPLSEFLWGSQVSTVQNCFRLFGSLQLSLTKAGDPFYVWANTFSTQPFLILTFLAPILAYSALLLKRKDKNVFFFAILSLIGIFLMKGAAAPLGNVNLWFFNNVPFSAAFRAQYEKFAILLVISYAFLIGVTLNELYARANLTKLANNVTKRMKLVKRHSYFILLIFIMLSMFIISAFPFWNGDVIKPQGTIIPSFRIQVPAYYTDASSWINGQQDQFRILELPPNVDALNWTNGYVGNNIGFYLFDKPVIYQQSDSNQIINYTYDNLQQNTPQNVGKMLTLLNIKYIIVQNDADLNYDTEVTPPSFYSQVLNTTTDVKFDMSFGALEFYNNTGWSPIEIYAPSNAFLVQGGINEAVPVIARNDFIPNDSVLFLSSPNSDGSLTNIFNASEINLAKPDISYEKINPTQYANFFTLLMFLNHSS